MLFFVPLTQSYVRCFLDKAGIHFKMLNESKGAAVWVSMRLISTARILTLLQSPRAQVDRKLYKKHMQAALHSYPNLDIHAGSVWCVFFHYLFIYVVEILKNTLCRTIDSVPCYPLLSFSIFFGLTRRGDTILGMLIYFLYTHVDLHILAN